MKIVLMWLAACAPPATPGAEPSTPADVVSPNVLVDCLGHGDFATLAEAISSSVDGDIIDVAPCTYFEQVDFGGHTVTLRATAGPATTIIDAGGVGPVVVVQGGEGAGTAVVGFTLTGGVETAYGAAVFADLSKIRLEHVIISGNRGAAILYGHSADIELLEASFSGNTVATSGSTITTYRGTVNAKGLDIACDGGRSAMYFGHGSALIDASNVECTGRNALYWEHATGRVTRSRLAGLVVVINEEGHDTDVVTMENDIFTGGEGIYVNFGTALLRNSVVDGTLTLVGVNNPVVESNIFVNGGCAIAAELRDTTFTPSYNTFWSVGRESCDGTVWSGVDGNFAADPLFTDEAVGDYTLAAGSPCIDSGLTAAVHQDVDDSRNDVGAYGGRKTMAGGW